MASLRAASTDLVEVALRMFMEHVCTLDPKQRRALHHSDFDPIAPHECAEMTVSMRAQNLIDQGAKWMFYDMGFSSSECYRFYVFQDQDDGAYFLLHEMVREDSRRVEVRRFESLRQLCPYMARHSKRWAGGDVCALFQFLKKEPSDQLGPDDVEKIARFVENFY